MLHLHKLTFCPNFAKDCGLDGVRHMPALLPLYIFFVVLFLLMPPVSLIVAVIKRHRRSSGGLNVTLKYVVLAASILPLLLNLIYAISIRDDLMAGQINTDVAFWFAIAVSWASLWGRFAVRRFGRHRRYISY